MSDDPYRPVEISVTIKYQGKDQPWHVFKGSVENVKAAMIEAYDLDIDPATVTLHEVTNMGYALVNFGGTVLKSGEDASGGTVVDASDRFGKQDKQEDPLKAAYDRLSAAMEEVESTEALKELWARNKEEFAADSRLMDIYKSRGKALKTAGK